MKTSTERRLFDNPDWVRDILNTSSTGLWSICVNTKTGKAGMFASAMMLELLGLDDPRCGAGDVRRTGCQIRADAE